MTQPLPLPATPSARAAGCTCGRLRQNPDCPLHSESARAARDGDRAQPFRLQGGAN